MPKTSTQILYLHASYLEFLCSMFQQYSLWQNIGTTIIDTTVTWVCGKLNWLCGGYINDLRITRSQAVCCSTVSANTRQIFSPTTCSQMLHLLSLTVILVASWSVLWTIRSVQKKFAYPYWTVIGSVCHVLSLPLDKTVSCVPRNVVNWRSFSLRISTTSGISSFCSVSIHILLTATRQLFKKGMACHPDAVFPSHSTKVTCIIKATPPLPSSRSPGTSYISGVMELAPLSPFLKITQSPPGIISDKFGHKRSNPLNTLHVHLP